MVFDGTPKTLAGKPDLTELLCPVYAPLPRISIDYALMEKAGNVAIARAGFEKIDVIGESDFPLDCMTNDPTGQAILISLRGSPEEIKKVEGSISSLKVSARKPGP